MNVRLTETLRLKCICSKRGSVWELDLNCHGTFPPVIHSGVRRL